MPTYNPFLHIAYPKSLFIFIRAVLYNTSYLISIEKSLIAARDHSNTFFDSVLIYFVYFRFQSLFPSHKMMIPNSNKTFISDPQPTNWNIIVQCIACEMINNSIFEKRRHLLGVTWKTVIIICILSWENWISLGHEVHLTCGT